MKILFFIESGAHGPGPTYKTLDKIHELIDLGVIHSFPDTLYSLSELETELIDTHIDSWCYANSIQKLIRTQYIQNLNIDTKEPLTLVTGFYGPDVDKLRSQIGNLLIDGSQILIANGAVGYKPSFVNVNARDWTNIEVSKSLKQQYKYSPPSMVESQVFKHSKHIEKITKVIFNNPFNWSDDIHTEDYIISSLVEPLLIPLLKELPDNIELNIVCRSQQEKEMLERLLSVLCPDLLSSTEIRGPEYGVKQQIQSGTLVIAQGVGVMEDCLATIGAIGIQIIKSSTQSTPDLYNLLLDNIPNSDSADYKIISGYKNFSNNIISVRNLVFSCFSKSSGYRERYISYVCLFKRTQESLWSSRRSILQSLLEKSTSYTFYDVVSLGSFLKINHNLTLNGFEDLDGVVMPNIGKIMAVIEQYKEGLISTAEFRSQMVFIMELEGKCTKSQFDIIWNSMIIFNDNDVKYLHEGISELKETGFNTIALTSSTNEIHQQYIQKRLNEYIRSEFYASADNTNQNPTIGGIELFLSYKYGATNYRLYDFATYEISVSHYNPEASLIFTLVIGSHKFLDTDQDQKDINDLCDWARRNGNCLEQSYNTLVHPKLSLDNERPLLLMAPRLKQANNQQPFYEVSPDRTVIPSGLSGP